MFILVRLLAVMTWFMMVIWHSCIYSRGIIYIYRERYGGEGERGGGREKGRKSLRERPHKVEKSKAESECDKFDNISALNSEQIAII